MAADFDDSIDRPATPAVNPSDRRIVVFADITCPFTHVGLRRLVAERDARRGSQPIIVSSWPLELVNAEPLRGAALAPKIAALQASVAPALFAGFDPEHFPETSLPALALVAAGYRHDAAAGERLSLAVRTALFEEGADIADPVVLDALATECGLPGLVGDDQQVIDDWHRGEALHVTGSPHFFLPGGGDYFCPALSIGHGESGLTIAFDQAGFGEFLDAAFA
jgi:predicted DsbA family dithiol-disulfide isomerase